MPTPDRDEFARLLNLYLRTHDRSGRWLARRLRVSPSTVTRWLNGEYLPRDADMIERILDVLGVFETENRTALYEAAGYVIPENAARETPSPDSSVQTSPEEPPPPEEKPPRLPSRPREWPEWGVGLLVLALVLLSGISLVIWQPWRSPTRAPAPSPSSVLVASPSPAATPSPAPSPAPSATPRVTSTSICGEAERASAPPADRFLRLEGVSAFTTGNTQGLVLSDDVRSLAVDERGVWIGYFPPPAGVGHYDGQTWANCTKGLDFPVTRVNALVIDGQGRVWVGTEQNGVAMFDGAAWRHFTTANGLPSDGIFGLTVQRTQEGEERIWAATWEGVARFDGDRWSTPYSVYNGTLVNNHTIAVAFDAAGNIWVGYVERGVSQYSAKEARWIHYRAEDGDTVGGDHVRKILVRPAGQYGAAPEPESVWFATADGGVSRYQQGAWTVYTTTAGLPGISAGNLALDRYGRVWAATDRGDAFFDGVGWRQRTSLPTRVLAFGPNCRNCPFDADDMWTGTNGSGVTHAGLPLTGPAVDVLAIRVPEVVAPGEAFRPEVVLAPRSPFRLKEGDALIHVDPDESLRFGAYRHIAVRGVVEPGQPYTFTDYDNPFVAPDLSDGETERTFTSTWRLWMSNRYVDPPVTIRFTVRRPAD